jgi:anti-anti-sigma regulatory factor
MLKISVIKDETRNQLVLEGKLIAPWTNELKSVLQSATLDLDHRELVIDLRGLTVISADGEEALLDLMVRGAKFRGSDVFTKQVLKQLARRAQRNGHRTAH